MRIATLVTLLLVAAIATPSAALADGYYLIDSARKDGPAFGTAQTLNLLYMVEKVWCGCGYNAEFGLPWPTEEPLLGHIYGVYGWGDSPDMLASDAAMIPVTCIIAGEKTVLSTAPVQFISSIDEMEEVTGTARNPRQIFLIKKFDLCVKHDPIREQIEEAILRRKYGKVHYGSFQELVADFNREAKGFLKSKSENKHFELDMTAARVQRATERNPNWKAQADKVEATRKELVKKDLLQELSGQVKDLGRLIGRVLPKMRRFLSATIQPTNPAIAAVNLEAGKVMGLYVDACWTCKRLNDYKATDEPAVKKLMAKLKATMAPFSKAKAKLKAKLKKS